MLWALLIFILSTLPGNDIPLRDVWDQFNLDKLIHAGMYFVQVILLLKGLKEQTLYQNMQKSAGLISFLFCVIYGGLLEIIQSNFCVGRTGSIFDFAANSIGALAGWFLFKCLGAVTKMF